MATWVDAGSVEELPDGSRRLLRTGGCEIALFAVAAPERSVNEFQIQCGTRNGCAAEPGESQ